MAMAETEVAEMSKPVSIIHVAKRAGTSIATVSRVFNQKKNVREETAAHVKEIAAQLGYCPDSRGRSLRSGRHWNLGILAAFGSYRDTQFSESMISHLVRCVTKEDYGTSLEFLERSKGKKLVRPELLAANKVDGIFVVGHLSDHELRQMSEWNVPVCLLDNNYVHPGFSSVNLVHEEGSRKAVAYLASLGHRRIGFVHGTLEWPSTRNRYEGYLKAVQEMGLEQNPDHQIQVDERQQNYQGGFYGTLELLQRTPLIDAIFYVNDWYAIGGLAAIQSTGRKVPDDISVIGYDDYWMADEVVPSLTTISEEVDKLCHAGVNLLINSIEHYSDIQSSVLVQPRLIKRKSCSAKI